MELSKEREQLYGIRFGYGLGASDSGNNYRKCNNVWTIFYIYHNFMFFVRVFYNIFIRVNKKFTKNKKSSCILNEKSLKWFLLTSPLFVKS